ncbi:MAG: SIMPL domain-containing protein [Dehalococcoidia bacterium]|nr:SIMPL domain-containing protein [Dehalococcoidia bacterium]
MKNKTWIILAAAVVLVGLAAAGCQAGSSGAANSNSGNTAQQSGIWVTGQGKVTGVPDTAVVVLGIAAQATTVTEAQGKARTAMDAVVKVLKAKGVKDNDIQTQRFSITPITQWIEKENRQQIIGYIVDNMVTAKIRQTDSAGPIIDAVADAGGDLIRINSISFTIDDQSTLLAQAQELALKDAKAKAKVIADTMGIRLGILTYAQVSDSTPMTPYPVYASKDSASGPASIPDTSINAGEITIRATVTAAWGIQ